MYKGEQHVNNLPKVYDPDMELGKKVSHWQTAARNEAYDFRLTSVSAMMAGT